MDWSPFWLSLRVAGWATFFSVTIGLLIAYLLSRKNFIGHSVAEGVVNLPLVLPPTVLGYALLVALGRDSSISHAWQHITGHPLDLVFTWKGAVAAACVASIPLFISHARVAISMVDRDVIDAARTEGASRLAILRFILIPLAWPGLLAGTALSFTRALGDFGATLMIAGDTPGQTRTMPLAIYDAVMMGDDGIVKTFVVICCILCLSVSIAASSMARKNRI